MDHCDYTLCPGYPEGTHTAQDEYEDEYHDKCWSEYVTGSGVFFV